MMCNLAKEKTLELYFFSFKFRLIETRKLRSEIYFYIYLRIEKLKIECNFQFSISEKIEWTNDPRMHYKC